MNVMRITLAGLLMMCGAVAFGNPTQCTYGVISRTIEVVYSDPGQPLPCEVIYSKSEQRSIEVLWRADNDANYCELKAAELIEKLQGFGWTCGSTPAEAP